MRIALPIVLGLLAAASFTVAAEEEGEQSTSVSIQELRSAIDPDCRHFGHYVRVRLGEELWSEAATVVLNVWDAEGAGAAAAFAAQMDPATADPSALLVGSAAARIAAEWELARDLSARIFSLPPHPIHSMLAPTIEEEEDLAVGIAQANRAYSERRFGDADAILAELMESHSGHWRAGVISYRQVLTAYFGGDLDRFHGLALDHLVAFPHYPFNARVLHLLASMCNLRGMPHEAVQYIHMIPECSEYYRQIRHVELKALVFKDESMAVALQSDDPSIYDDLLEEALEIAISEEDKLWFQDYVAMTRRWAVAREELDWGTSVITESTRKARDQGLITQAEANRIAYHHLDILFRKVGEEDFNEAREQMLEALAPLPDADPEEREKFLAFGNAVATYYKNLREKIEEAASAGLLPSSFQEVEQ